MPIETLLQSIGSVSLYSGRGPTYCIGVKGSSNTLSAKPTGKQIWMYDIKPVACLELKSKKACAQVFKWMTGYDMDKAPVPSLRRTCKCRKPIPILVQNYTNRRNYRSGMRYFTCSKCGGFLEGVSAGVKRKSRYD